MKARIIFGVLFIHCVLCLLLLGCTAARIQKSDGVVRRVEGQPAAAPWGEPAAVGAASTSAEPTVAAPGEKTASLDREPGEEAFDFEERAEKAVQALKRSRNNGSLEVWRYLSENYEKMPLVSKSVYEYSWGAFEIDVKKKTFGISYRGGDLVDTIRGEFVGENENEWRINLVLQ